MTDPADTEEVPTTEGGDNGDTAKGAGKTAEETAVDADAFIEQFESDNDEKRTSTDDTDKADGLETRDTAGSSDDPEERSLAELMGFEPLDGEPEDDLHHLHDQPSEDDKAKQAGYPAPVAADARPRDDVDSQPDQAPASDQEAPSDKPTVLEMRQVAGLTSGSVMGLHQGSFQFRESNKEIGFSLTVNDSEDVVVIPGSAVAMIDEIIVDNATPLGDSVLNVGTACFTVRSPRQQPDNEARLAAMLASRTAPKAIPVPEFQSDQPAVQQQASSRFGSLFSRQSEEPEAELDAQSWHFLESIRDVRNLVAERHRNLHPNPEELKSRLDRLDPGLWDRSVEHPLFARFPVAYSTIPWEPRFDAPERIPTELHRPIQEMSCLPWVPITANLLFGPLGIVGGRSAVLACARNAVLSLSGLCAPSDIEFSIVTAEALVSDWDWTSSLPNSLFPGAENKYCVTVADGMTHFDGAGLDAEAVKNNEMGLIVLEETVEQLPDYCGTVLQLTPEGQCQVTNHLGEQIVGTPIGVAAGFAASAAAVIREAIGDGPDPEAGSNSNSTSDSGSTADSDPD